MRTLEQIFGAQKVVPTATIEDMDLAIPTAEALLKAGVKVMTLRMMSQKSFRVLELIAKKLPEITVGAGAIMDAAGFLNASLAGAQFISSAGITPELMTAARTRFNDAHFLPGALVPSHVMESLSRGFDVMNLFPAHAFNGAALLDAYAYTFPSAKFTVSGGITVKNMHDYLLKSNVAGVAISDVANHELILNKDFREIETRAKTLIVEANKLLKI